ncbi:hypothetical protein GE061_007767 [Apolygus lucorum]|uniref:Uncharacterized protein n=1 Tax=Apolygus lucorum TaxID=248454 RepID=A0A8S9WMB2_APOLU|nr:hypothetical protein GE061_007767 [Apolygus lucorum]
MFVNMFVVAVLHLLGLATQIFSETELKNVSSESVPIEALVQMYVYREKPHWFIVIRKGSKKLDRRIAGKAAEFGRKKLKNTGRVFSSGHGFFGILKGLVDVAQEEEKDEERKKQEDYEDRQWIRNRFIKRKKISNEFQERMRRNLEKIKWEVKSRLEQLEKEAKIRKRLLIARKLKENDEKRGRMEKVGEKVDQEVKRLIATLKKITGDLLAEQKRLAKGIKTEKDVSRRYKKIRKNIEEELTIGKANINRRVEDIIESVQVIDEKIMVLVLPIVKEELFFKTTSTGYCLRLAIATVYVHRHNLPKPEN